MSGDSLPPRVGAIKNGSITWHRLEAIDYQTLGYFLSCHLIVEHYLDEYLRIEYPTLDWEVARLTFGQKVAMLSSFKISDRYDCIPSIKHMNALRNKLSHKIDFKITEQDLLPLIQYLEKVYEGQDKIPTEPREILSQYTTMTCVLFAGYISSKARHEKVTREELN